VPQRALVVVVTPVFNEEEGLERYAEDVTRVLLENKETEFRVILVDDGSSDHSWEVISDICARDPRFRGVRLSRNFGSHVALSAGFAHVDPEASAAATLACDLQDPPETILEFVEKWREGADIVWGERLSRQDSGWKVMTSKLFNRALTKHAMPRGSKFTTGSFLLVDRVVLDCFNQFKEHNRITFALVAWTGFDQVRVPYHRVARTTGTSGWSFPKMLKSMYDAFIGLSTLPIRVMKWAAAIALLIAVILMIYTIALATLTRTDAPGWASQMLVLAGFFAVQFTLMAIVGEYLNRIYTESMRRPFFFVSRDTAHPRQEPLRRPVAAERHDSIPAPQDPGGRRR
jgi:glycosyltransferase involved in cell wall biosynthesis